MIQPNQSFCHKCGTDLGIKPGTIVGRGDSCAKCRADVKVCKNCKHYDPKAYNECHETMADRIVDKEKSNFCDYFSLRSGLLTPGETKDAAAEARKKLDDLFK